MDDHIDPTTSGSTTGSPSGSRCHAPKTRCCCAAKGAIPTMSKPARPGLCRDGAQPSCTWGDPADRQPRRLRAMPGLLAIYTAADLAAGGDRPTAAAPGHEQSRRNADAEALSATRSPPTRCAMSGTRWPSSSPRRSAAARTRPKPWSSRSNRCRRSASRTRQMHRARRKYTTRCPAMSGLDFHYGDSEAVAAAFARAAHVTQPLLARHRIVVNAMEPRSANAQYDPEREHWTLHIGCQGVFGFCKLHRWRARCRARQGAGPDRPGRRLVRHEAADYPEHFCIMLAARELGRPVKWTDERSGSFVSDTTAAAMPR